MHMSDALVSPAVGGAMWAVSAAGLYVASRKVSHERDDRLPPLMGVLGAFVFAAQMINFTIPATGSSGHIGGGILLAALLGPWAACIVMACILAIQAFLFADGGLLALGCNIANLALLPCLVAYPLIYRTINRGTNGISPSRIAWGGFLAAIVGLQLGAFGVVVETTLSGITELPFSAFVALMQPIHLAIGGVEGLATAALLLFLARMRPALYPALPQAAQKQHISYKPFFILMGILVAAVGGLLSWYASSLPDGLEWAAERTHPSEIANTSTSHETLARIQEKTSILPDYNLPAADQPRTDIEERAGTSLSGLAGASAVAAFLIILGLILRRKKTVRTS